MAASPALAGFGLRATWGTTAGPGESFVFDEIAHGVDETHHVPGGYAADILIRWGDPVLADAPSFDPLAQSAAAQARQFGYNNDFIGYFPLPADTENAHAGLLAVNHEYTIEKLMFPPASSQAAVDFAALARERVDIEMAAHGSSVIEIARDARGKWRVVQASPYNRRITVNTIMAISGPAAGHATMRTRADPSGRRVAGTISNCAGGVTPWGTVLMAEENFHYYFAGSADNHPDKELLSRYGMPNRQYDWGRYYERFDLDQEPNEPNRFGWVVEVDPYDAQATPVKRTALGRFKHEGAGVIVNGDGRVIVYSGDDQRFEYLYRFVSHNRFDPDERAANRRLLDDGTLFVARFNDDGFVDWLPLIWATGPLTPDHGFASQADVLVNTRHAADLLGATPMDRPEDIDVRPDGSAAYIMLTNNTRRDPNNVDAANPRGPNPFGHVIELRAADGDHAALRAEWDILVQCGDPSIAGIGAHWNPATSENGWFASPDNCAFDPAGRLWVTTDQGGKWSKTGTADGVWALHTRGEGRGTGRMFFRAPVGSEVCGPCFTPDGETLFVAVQHPAADGADSYPGFERDSTYQDPVTRWPDFDPGIPPRPSVVAITRTGGGKIGGP